MKTPGKNQKKQNSSETPESKANVHKTKINTNKDSGKGPWKNPDPTDPKKSPEKVNEPYAEKRFPGNKTTKAPTTGIRKEKITNAGESEHHIPVNKGEYEKFENEYEDFEFEEEEEDDDDTESEENEDDERGETSADNFYEDEEDESRQFRSKVIPAAQQKLNEQAKLQQKKGNNKTLENKNKSPLNVNFTQKKNNNPQG